MTDKTRLIHIGTFEVVDNNLKISDPCYGPGTWCSGIIENVKQGTWNAYVLYGPSGWGDSRPWELIAIHSGYPQSLSDKMTENSGIDVGVDSGQAGIYSESKFHGGEDDYGEGGWYDLCCNATLNADYSAETIDGGCVSMSGYGDGGYECFVARDGTTEVVGVKIVFITSSPEEEEEDDWDGESGYDEEDE